MAVPSSLVQVTDVRQKSSTELESKSFEISLSCSLVFVVLSLLMIVGANSRTIQVR
jgi:hypothetical protein